MNRLYYGDCLTIMQGMPLLSVDLIYLDPPFNSKKDYHAIYKDETGMPLPDQIEAFCDQWMLDEESERVIRHMPILVRDAGIDDSVVRFWQTWMNALRYTQPGLLAYLTYMVERLIWMKGLLRPTGSIYLHCDPTASHYIKVMLDGIFGHKNFRSEIIWKRTSAHNRAKKWGPVHDTILFYSKSEKYKWNLVYQPYDDAYLDSYYGERDEKGRFSKDNLTGPGTRNGSSGLPWKGVDPRSKGRHWELPPDRSLPTWFCHPRGYAEMNVQERLNILDDQGMIHWPKRGSVPRFKRYLNTMEGMRVQDVIYDIPPVSGDEDMGYDTQKPIALLERIIKTSTSKGDVVLDPFCGCATTIESAHKLERQWIGIDIAIHAIKRVAKVRLEDRLRLVEGNDFEIHGWPQNIEGAQDLWTRDSYQFQKWAVEHVDGFVTNRKTGDGGIDGRLYFALPQEGSHKRDPLRSMVIEVKGGHNVGISTVRDLRGVLERDDAEMAGLIVLHELGDRQKANFGREMASAGDMEVMGRQYSRMQILTIQEIMAGKRFDTPGAIGRSSGQSIVPSD